MPRPKRKKVDTTRKIITYLMQTPYLRYDKTKKIDTQSQSQGWAHRSNKELASQIGVSDSSYAEIVSGLRREGLLPFYEQKFFPKGMAASRLIRMGLVDVLTSALRKSKTGQVNTTMIAKDFDVENATVLNIANRIRKKLKLKAPPRGGANYVNPPTVYPVLESHFDAVRKGNSTVVHCRAAIIEIAQKTGIAVSPRFIQDQLNKFNLKHHSDLTSTLAGLGLNSNERSLMTISKMLTGLGISHQVRVYSSRREKARNPQV